MKQQILKYRDKAKLVVFSNFFNIVVAYFLSQIVTTLIMNFFLISAGEKNVDLASKTPEMLFTVVTVAFLALLASLPLVASFYYYLLSLSKSTVGERVPLKTFFTLFSKPTALLKCSFAVLILSVLYALSSVFVLPVFYMLAPTLLVLFENPETSFFKALSTSRRTMKGRKMLAFRTSLPFLILSLVASALSATLPFFSVLIAAVSEAMFYTSIALVYLDARADLD